MQPLIITRLSNRALLQYAKRLANEGYIQQQNNYCYLKIDDEYIHSLYPLLLTHESITKPPYFAPPKQAGAHISVIYPAEQRVLKPNYLGQKHSFIIRGLINARYGAKEYFALAVHAPTLGQLRAAHCLALKPQFKEQAIVFHITIGIRVTN